MLFLEPTNISKLSAGSEGQYCLFAPPRDANPAVVTATFVCLDNAPDGFGDRVTQSRNRQNAVDLEDFAALDERQSMWQQTLRMASIEYIVLPMLDDVLDTGHPQPASVPVSWHFIWPAPSRRTTGRITWSQQSQTRRGSSDERVSCLRLVRYVSPTSDSSLTL